jgi:hypothetical protein
MNEGDYASDAEEAFRRQALTNAGEKARELKPKGLCHWCYEPVAAGRVFCPPVEDSCAEDYRRHRAFNAGAKPHG